VNKGGTLAKRALAVRWEELPLGAWDREIAAQVAFRPASEAYSDALLPRWCSEIQVHADGKIDHLFIDRLVQRITYELRVCRDIYRKHLEAMQLESAKRCHFIAYEYAVAPRAADRLRRGLLEYFHCAAVSFDSLQMLFDPSWPQPPLKPTVEGWKEGEFAKDFDELMVILIPSRMFQGLDEKIGVGNPFASHHLRRLALHGAVDKAIELYKIEFWWIKHAGFLWSRVYSEVERQREEIEIEPDQPNDRPQQQSRLSPPAEDVRAEMMLKHARKKITSADASTLMRVEEAAAILSMSPQTVYRWADEGTNGIKRTPGTPVRIYAMTVKAYLESAER
jgi:excisionase family DNA binding protein